MQLLARNNDPPLGVVTKKMQREGLFREIKERRACEKPSERRVREKAQAISHHYKATQAAAPRTDRRAGANDLRSIAPERRRTTPCRWRRPSLKG